MSTLTTFIQCSFGSPSHGNQRQKRHKRTQTGKEQVKLSLFADDMILYIENPKDATSKLLELINDFSKFSGYKINTQKYLVFYTLTKKDQKEKLKKQSHLPLQKKRIKYLGINLPKEAKDLYSKKYKT